MGIYINNIDIPKEPFVSIILRYDGSVHVWSSYKGEGFETKATPVTDVRPVARGKWVYNDGDNIPYCSECMMPQDSECNFCPNCGADMREES